MAENITNKSFLDWEGLQTLWTKINLTFANKSVIDGEIDTIKGDLGSITGEFDTFKSSIQTSIDGINDTITTIAPRDVENYTAAITLAPSLSAGTILNIKNNETIGDKTYFTGLYMVTNPTNDPNNPNNIIEKISTSSGSGVGSNVEELSESLAELYRVAITNVGVVDEHGNTLSNSGTQKSENALIIQVDNNFDANTDSVNALTHRAIAAMYGDLIERIDQLPKFNIKIVDELPTENISSSTIYLVTSNKVETDSLYAEYIYVTTGNEGKWEKLGEQSINIDDYITVSAAEELINNKIQEIINTSIKDDIKEEIIGDLTESFATKDDVKDNVNKTDLTTILGGYYTKTEVDNSFLTINKANDLFIKSDDISDLMTEADIITSITTGAIGNAIRISDDQINSLVVNNA